MRTRPDHYYRQSAVIPFRARNGRLEALLVTSRSAKRWVVPKGVVEPDLSPAESAAKEAHEEAGIEERLSSEAIGRYRYKKWGGISEVEVFVMEVETILDRWPRSCYGCAGRVGTSACPARWCSPPSATS